MQTLDELKLELKEVENQIKEAEQRLPAHSTKPATMMMLLDLEDERDRLSDLIKALEAKS
jgi:hypothetical protein